MVPEGGVVATVAVCEHRFNLRYTSPHPRYQTHFATTCTAVCSASSNPPSCDEAHLVDRPSPSQSTAIRTHPAQAYRLVLHQHARVGSLRPPRSGRLTETDTDQ